MTHTLHREGSLQIICDDYLLLVTPTVGCNDIGCPEKLNEIIDMVFDGGVTNIGSYELKKSILSGVDAEEIKEGNIGKPKPIMRCVFDNIENFKKTLSRIVKADLGLSITITGPRSSLNDIMEELNIEPHSMNISMGTYGATEKLPDENIRMITTMCGHALVSPELVKDMMVKIKKNETSSKTAGIELAKPCVCGIFNQERATEVLEHLIQHNILKENP